MIVLEIAALFAVTSICLVCFIGGIAVGGLGMSFWLATEEIKAEAAKEAAEKENSE